MRDVMGDFEVLKQGVLRCVNTCVEFGPEV